MKRLGAAALLLCLALFSAPAEAGVTTTNKSHILPGNNRSSGLPQPSLPDFREPGIRKRVILRRSAGPGHGRKWRPCSRRRGKAARFRARCPTIRR